MITAYLNGGMGNQMFQYAAALAACVRLGGSGLELNASSFANDPMRQYSLGLWAGVNEPIRLVPPTGDVVRERELPYDAALARTISRSCTLWGYFQSEKWFSGAEEKVVERFVPHPLTVRGLAMERKIRAAGGKSVFLTVRRTDYVTSDFHGVMPMDYYLRALELVAAKVGKPEVFVFSDEPEWCEANFRLPCRMTVAGNFDRTTKSHLGREDEELWLMSRCAHAIMANSTYSWWGAWMGSDRTGGTVVAPKQWFINADADSRDIVPERWVRL